MPRSRHNLDVSESDPPGDGPAPAAGASGSFDVRLSDPELAPIIVRPAAGPVVAAASPAERKRGLGAKVVHAADAIGGSVVRAGGAVGNVVGESLSHLPVMPKTRRGRVMARSVMVSFVLVFGWIAVIVGLQLRGTRPPDFRPEAERILIALRDGQAADVYDQASIRFQSLARDAQTFIDQMDDMNRTLGRFRELTAVIATKVNRGPGGRTGRLDVALEYDKGKTRGSLSFRWEDRRWKLLGLSIEVPEKIRAEASTEGSREERSSARPDEIAELRAAVEEVLVRSAHDQIDQLWQEASPAFQQAIAVDDLRRTEADRRRTLGVFGRVLDVRAVRLNPKRNYATLVVLLQFEQATITGNFEFSRSGDRWRLVIYKLVLPVLQAPPEAVAPPTE